MIRPSGRRNRQGWHYAPGEFVVDNPDHGNPTGRASRTRRPDLRGRDPSRRATGPARRRSALGPRAVGSWPTSRWRGRSPTSVDRVGKDDQKPLCMRVGRAQVTSGGRLSTARASAPSRGGCRDSLNRFLRGCARFFGYGNPAGCPRSEAIWCSRRTRGSSPPGELVGPASAGGDGVTGCDRSRRSCCRSAQVVTEVRSVANTAHDGRSRPDAGRVETLLAVG